MDKRDNGWWIQMDTDQRRKIRRVSMLGTAVFALGILVAIVALVNSSAWLVGAAVIFLVPGVLMLHRVGKSLP